MSVWEFDVAVTTHAGLQRGELVDHYVSVQVEAETWTEASCLAIQMAGIVGYATECLDRI